MKTYSQVGQDLWVLEILKYQKNGYFLDIGAYDGIKFSNSYLLELEHNWTGTLVEANPSNFHRMIKNRPNTNNIMCAITDKVGYISINNKGMSSQLIEGSGYKIETKTFEQLFKLYDIPKSIDYMSLDIEGYEGLALTRFPFHTHICKTITVEHNLYLNGNSNKILINNILKKNNYILLKENISHDNNPFEDWYIHESILS